MTFIAIVAEKTDRTRRNFVPWNRNWQVIRRHAPVVLKPLLSAWVIAGIWKFGLYDHGIHFSKEAENPLLFMILPLVAFIYVIFASLAVSAVFNEYKTVSRCVVKKDLETFLLHRDEQLPIIMHILVGAPSLLLVLLSMFFYYHDPVIGAVSVFSVVFMVVITWVIATELDDYERSVWFKEKIPKSWFETDIDKFFAKKKST
jgi:hypothetical protein